MAFYSYLSTKIIIMTFITKSYQNLFGVRSYINAFSLPHIKYQFSYPGFCFKLLFSFNEITEYIFQNGRLQNSTGTKTITERIKRLLTLTPILFCPLIGTRTSYYILVPYHFITDMMIRSVSAGNICLSKSCVNVPNALPRNRMVSSYLSDYVLHTKRFFLQKYKIGAIKYYPIRLKTSIT